MSQPDFWFYQLEGQPIEMVLPALLEKTRARGWRACLRFSSEERIAAIDSALWTYREDAFLAHGTARDGFSERQPIFLTTGMENSNRAEVLFLLEGADEPEPERFKRIVHIFDCADVEALSKARAEWKSARERGFEVSYWRLDGRGGWVKSG
jgi:DNA polymerase-3 subunit chi